MNTRVEAVHPEDVSAEIVDMTGVPSAKPDVEALSQPETTAILRAEYFEHPVTGQLLRGDRDEISGQMDKNSIVPVDPQTREVMGPPIFAPVAVEDSEDFEFTVGKKGGRGYGFWRGDDTQTSRHLIHHARLLEENQGIRANPPLPQPGGAPDQPQGLPPQPVGRPSHAASESTYSYLADMPADDESQSLLAYESEETLHGLRRWLQRRKEKPASESSRQLRDLRSFNTDWINPVMVRKTVAAFMVFIATLDVVDNVATDVRYAVHLKFHQAVSFDPLKPWHDIN